MAEPDIPATLERLRARGAGAAAAVRFDAVAAMARRAGAQQGDARRLLEARMAALLAAAEAPSEAGAPAAAAAADGPALVAAADSLAALTALLGRQAAARGESPLPAPPGAGLAARPEPKALDFFRRTWARLSAERRLTQSLETLPDNPGPLNSQHLVHRALTLMREQSPGYLHRFMARADALAALEQLLATPPASAASAPRAEGARKTARTRKAKAG